jgi:hypothetical protein
VHNFREDITEKDAQYPDYVFILILWRIEPLLDKDLETNNETTAVAKEQRGKHASTTIEVLCNI